jgi:methionyl-tRNA formyltransferase
MKKRIIFMGTPNFAAHILENLLQNQSEIYDIIAVVSQPDRPIGRKRILTPTPVKSVATEYNIPIFQPEKIGEITPEITTLQPDLIITAAYGQFVPEKILTIPKHKCINIHGSLLPKYRGGAPIHRAIINGEQKTGITIMYMVKKMDAGDILYQKELPILQTDTLETMYDKLQELGAICLQEMLPTFLNGEITPIPQAIDQVTYAPNIQREERKINWQNSAIEIFNHVRGLAPVPTAYTTLQSDKTDVKIFEVEVIMSEKSTKEPGTIQKATNKICYVATGDGVIALKNLQLSGKKRQTIQEVMNGAGIEILAQNTKFE